MERVTGHTLTITLLLLAVCTVSDASPQSIDRLITDYYTLNTATTVTSTALTTANTNIGVCICDLTETHCDANCCCDNDCVGTTYSTSFTSCLTEGANGTYAFICENRDTLMTAHPPSFADMTRNFLDDMICVEISNNPTSGDFFSDPGTADSSTFSIQKTQWNVWLPSDLTLTLSTDTSTRYKVGQVVNGAQLNTNIIGVHSGGMILPQPGFTGECSNTTYVEFLTFQRPSKCSIQVDDIQTVCNLGAELQPWSSTLKVGSLRVGTKQNSNVATTTDWITPTVNSAKKRAVATGILSDLTAAEQTIAYTGATCTCANVLQELQYNIYTSDTGLIDSVTVDLIYTDVLPLATCANLGLGQAAYLQQTYSVQWFDTGKTASDVRYWSGNPGYLVGSPLLAGIAATTPTGAISPRKGGFMFNFGVGEGGQCTGSTVGYYEPVEFGKDLSYGCTKYMTKTQLQTFCSTTIDSVFTITDTYIGKWGNSSDYNSGDWITITKNTFTPTVTYTANDQTCAGVVTGVHLEVLTWNFGSWINPQTAVVAAQTRMTTDTLTYPLRDQGHPFPFHMRATVAFIEWSPQTAEEFTASPSPVLPTFPSDFFYPFLAASPASGPAPQLSLPLMLLLTLGVTALCLV